MCIGSVDGQTDLLIPKSQLAAYRDNACRATTGRSHDAWFQICFATIGFGIESAKIVGAILVNTFVNEHVFYSFLDFFFATVLGHFFLLFKKQVPSGIVHVRTMTALGGTHKAFARWQVTSFPHGSRSLVISAPHYGDDADEGQSKGIPQAFF
jgi:hypothetical protein